MPPSPPLDKRAAARELLAARARRVSAIRRRVIAATLAAFALAWGTVVWDGSMGASAAATAATAQAGRDASPIGSGSSGDSSGDYQPGAVTTAQS